jgi:hypothetical protein
VPVNLPVNVPVRVSVGALLPTSSSAMNFS